MDVPGGVQAHVADLAVSLMGLGHHVQVLAPAEDETAVPDFITPAGRAVPIRFNGSVARLMFGPVSAHRVRQWLRQGDFDVLHVHEPQAPSLSMLAVMVATGPVVATFHAATERSKALAASAGMLAPIMERITGRIAVSALARRVQVEHLAAGGVEIPNGVLISRFADASPLPGWPGPGGAVGFLGRYGEPRKGFRVLREAFTALASARPGLRLLVAGPGEPEEALAGLPPGVAERVVLLGGVADEEKAAMLSSVDVFVAPNTGGESFGMVLTEAMAAGTAVVASELDAFRAVLDVDSADPAGVLVPIGDAAALTTAIAGLLDNPAWRSRLAERGRHAVAAFDWPVVARQVLEVYRMSIEIAGSRVGSDTAGPGEGARLRSLSRRLR